MAESSSWFARLATRFRALFRREPAAGRWIEGTTFTFAGFVGFRFWTLPRRSFRLYLPRGFAKRQHAPLLVLIHGCRQTSADLAQGARITALADAQGIVVLMPDQNDHANPHRCWNWFDARTAAGKGEAAIVAKMILQAAKRWRADPARVVVAGMSAGAALAAVLGVRYPKLVRSVVAHSGIACGAAASAFTALTVMRRGPETDIAAIAMRARKIEGDVTVPLLAIQGADDDVVASRNAAGLARQFLALNGVPVPSGSETTLPPPDAESRDASTLPYLVRTREWQHDGRAIVRVVEIEGLGHAWSGGDPAVPFNDGAAPDATGMIGKWIEEAAR
jgi:poly(hydroxyalkanoate) depolymerase family esterase